MYKKILQSIQKSAMLAKAAGDLYKDGTNPVVSRKPHFIFSTESPKYPENKRYSLGHSDVMDLLQRKGYKTDEIRGFNGNSEKSIMVHNPSKMAVRHLLDLSKELGQESSIYSDGYNHELHFHGGEKAGNHVKGQGTTIHKRPPSTPHFKMSDGTDFTHLLNSNEIHGPDKSMVKQDDNIKKSERSGLLLTKNENKHRLETAGPDTKIIHYSSTPSLVIIDPFDSVNGGKIGNAQKRPKHPMSVFYLEGPVPKSAISDKIQAKYVARLGHHKLYDIGLDPDGIREYLKTSNQTLNPGSYTRDELDAEIKKRGYHGIYNSSLDDSMDNMVALYYPVTPDQEMKIHRKDLKKITATDHHGDETSLKAAKKFASENGHHDGAFLHNLVRRLSDNG